MYRRPFRFRRNLSIRADPIPLPYTEQFREDEHEDDIPMPEPGVRELGGQVQGLRLEEPENMIMPSQSQPSNALPLLPVDSVRANTSGSDDYLCRLLECPVCYTIPENEVYNCAKGHSVCGKCRIRLDQCALCASIFTGSRNFLVESLISYYKKVGFAIERTKPSASTQSEMTLCTHKYEGCKKLIPYSEKDAHARACEYRPVTCTFGMPNDKCHTILKLSDYFKHLRNRHTIVGMSEPSGIFMKTDRVFRGFELNTCWYPFYLQYDGKIFLRNAVLKNRMVSWWIQLIGPDSDSRKYVATISLQNPKNQNCKVAWTTPVFPIRCDEETIERNNTATISTANIIKFCAVNEQFEDRTVTHAWNCQMILSRVN